MADEEGGDGEKTKDDPAIGEAWMIREGDGQLQNQTEGLPRAPAVVQG